MSRLARRVAVTAGLAVLLVPLSSVFAQEPYPVADGYVLDAAEALAPATESVLEEELRAYEARTTNQVAVAVVPSLGGRTIETYASELFNSWGVGQARSNNGVLLVVATEDRQLRIEVGAGLLEELPNAEASSIVDREVVPRLRSGDIEGGVRSGTIGIRRALDDDVATPDVTFTALPVDAPQFDRYPGGGIALPSLFLLVIPIALVGFVLSRVAGGSDRCPSCGRALAWGGSARRGAVDHCGACGFSRQRAGSGVGFGSGLRVGGGATSARPSGGGESFGGGSSGGGGASGSW